MTIRHPVWTIFSRRSFSSLAYWSSTLGYNLRDRSASNRAYLLYFIAFWLFWVVAVFAMLGSALAPFLRRLAEPEQIVIAVYAYGLGLWLAWWLFNAGKRSPFVFPEEDAYLLCQTPVSRPSVAAAWFAQSWTLNALPLAALTGIISFALVESSITGAIMLPDILVYFRHSLLAIALVLPVLLALQALAWALGAWRLWYNRPSAWFRLVFLIPLAWLGADRALTYTSGAYSGPLLAGLGWPLAAAFARHSALEWGVAFGAWLALAAACAWLMLSAARRMSLGRAAQETTVYAAVQAARLGMQFELAQTLAARQRFTVSAPGHLLTTSARFSLLAGKDLQQSLRAINPLAALNWLALFGLTFGILLPGNWVVQGFALLLWVISLGNLTTRRLRSDLARWWLIRSLPVSTRRLLLGELGIPALAGVLLGWLALLAMPMLGQRALTLDYRLSAAAALPFICASTALAASSDICRRSKARTLMSPSIGEENVPSLNLWGVVQAFLSAGVPLAMLAWAVLHPDQLPLGAFAVPAAVLIASLNLQTAEDAYERIE